MTVTQMSLAEKNNPQRMVHSTFDVVMITTVHPATDDRIFYREAKTLADAGFSVCVIGRHSSSELRDGIWIEALPRSVSRARRLLMGWIVLNLVRHLRGKIIIFHDPELFAVGLVLTLLGYVVIYDAHENFPMQVLQKNWIPLPLRWILVPHIWFAEWLVARLIGGVIVATSRVLSRFPRNRTVLVRNFPTSSALHLLGGGGPVHLRQNVVLYTGGLSRIRGIAELVEAFSTPNLDDAELWLVGEFESQQFRDEILNSAPKNVKWFGFLEHPEVLKIHQLAKIGVVLLYPTPNHRYSLPVKLFEYLGAGLPVVASNFPELSDFVKGCGIQVNPRSVREIRAAILHLLSDDLKIAEMSVLARNRVVTSLSWPSEGATLVAFCSRLLRRTEARASPVFGAHLTQLRRWQRHQWLKLLLRCGQSRHHHSDRTHRR